MADEVLILRDNNGNYYQLDRRMLEAARVPEDRVAELESALGGEVTGYGATPTQGLLRFEAVGVLSPQPVVHFDIGHFDFGHTDHTDVPHVDTR